MILFIKDILAKKFPIELELESIYVTDTNVFGPLLACRILFLPYVSWLYPFRLVEETYILKRIQPDCKNPLVYNLLGVTVTLLE